MLLKFTFEFPNLQAINITFNYDAVELLKYLIYLMFSHDQPHR